MREDVIIKTATGDLRGHLFVGHDHLPELRIPSPATLAKHGIDTGKSGFDDYYRPANIPNTWEVQKVGRDAGILLRSWWDIGGVRARIVHYEREAEEAEERDTVREREIETRIEEELDVRP